MSFTKSEEAERLEAVELAVKELNRRTDKAACEFWAKIFKTWEEDDA